MRKLILIAGSLLFFAFPEDLKAQNDQSATQEVKTGVKKGAQGVKKGVKKGVQGVKKGANEVAEQASEAKADVTDREVESKMGPKGEDIFMDDNNRYYYIDEKGHRVYMAASDLRNKPPKADKD